MPSHVAVTGSSGLIGSALVAALTGQGHRVTRLVRRAPLASEAAWDPEHGTIDAAALEGVDAVVHLAGASIVGRRWSPEVKRVLRGSRVGSTGLVARTLAQLSRPPRVLVSTSAVGIYGSRGDEVLSEGSALGTGFLADLARDWEDAADPARRAGIRVAHPRFGLILGKAGGALPKMLLPFRLGLGGPLGEGRQWTSWLTVDEAVGVISFAIGDARVDGPFNAVAPTPVTNAQFTRTLAHVLRRPSFLSVPALAVRWVLGEMADETLLASQRVMPERLVALGYQFQHPALEGALRHVLQGHGA